MWILLKLEQMLPKKDSILQIQWEPTYNHPDSEYFMLMID